MNSIALSLSPVIFSSTWSSLLLLCWIFQWSYYTVQLCYFCLVLSKFFLCWSSHFVYAFLCWPPWGQKNALLWPLFWALLWPLFWTQSFKSVISISVRSVSEILFLCLKYVPLFLNVPSFSVLASVYKFKSPSPSLKKYVVI